MSGLTENEGVSLEYASIKSISDASISGIMSALQFQHRLFIAETGALLPEEIPLADAQVILDLICSAGVWSIDFSREHPDKQIYGVDMNERIIHMARKNASLTDLRNLQFAVEKNLPLTLFADETFDIIHFQNGAPLYPVKQWPGIMAELYRLLKPGGWLNLVDFEMGPVSTPALDRVVTLLAQIMARRGLSTSPSGFLPFNGCTSGPERLSQAMFTGIGYHLYPINLGGWNNAMGRAYLNSLVVRPAMIECYAVATGLATEEELQPLLREMQRELQYIDFCGMGMLVSAFGQKPL